MKQAETLCLDAGVLEQRSRTCHVSHLSSLHFAQSFVMVERPALRSRHLSLLQTQKAAARAADVPTCENCERAVGHRLEGSPNRVEGTWPPCRGFLGYLSMHDPADQPMANCNGGSPPPRPTQCSVVLGICLTMSLILSPRYKSSKEYSSCLPASARGKKKKKKRRRLDVPRV